LLFALRAIGRIGVESLAHADSEERLSSADAKLAANYDSVISRSVRSSPRVSRCPQIHGSVAESIDATQKLNIAKVGINYKLRGPVVAKD
jgi:hypothetical protein